jgi:predicted ferric reductase
MKIGHVLLFLTLCLSFFLFGMAKQADVVAAVDPLRYVSQLLAVVGTTLFAVSYILSGKLRIVEHLFGGLDTVFKLHTRLSVIAFLCLLHHPLLLMVAALPNTAVALGYIIPSTHVSYTAGISSLAILVLLLVITLFVFSTHQSPPFIYNPFNHSSAGG